MKYDVQTMYNMYVMSYMVVRESKYVQDGELNNPGSYSILHTEQYKMGLIWDEIYELL